MIQFDRHGFGLVRSVKLEYKPKLEYNLKSDVATGETYIKLETVALNLETVALNLELKRRRDGRRFKS